MAQLVIPQGVLIRLIWQRGGADHAVNVLGATNPGGTAITQAFANTVGAAIKGVYSSSGFVGRTGTTTSLSQVTLRNINIPDQGEFPDTGGAVAGTEGTHLLPPQIALVVTLRTALAGPSYRGRVYLTGFCEVANEAAGTCDSAAATDALAFVVGIQTALAANGLTLAVLSRPRDAQPLAIPPVLAKPGWATPVTSILLRNMVWDTQRRRAVPGI